MDENRYIPPDLAGAEKSFCQTAIYTEALWKNEFNKDESKVRSYTLPVIQSETVEQWEKEERPRLVEQFKEILYGDMPPAPDKLETEVLSEKDNALDALEQDPLVDAVNAAVIGHSRNGKAAVWAGVCDERFKLVISNNSGCGGASLSRRNFGETPRILFWEKRPWVAGNLVDYIDDPGKLPFDQHMVLGAIAPRYLYVASSSEDAVADPKGEFLAAQAASRVWELYGKTGLGEAEQPPLNVSTGVEVGYHCKEGKHGIRAFDWEQYYNFADKVFRRTR